MGSVSSAKSSRIAPASSPIIGWPRNQPPRNAATRGRDVIAWGTVTEVHADHHADGRDAGQLAGAHVKASRGTGAAVGTSCAVTDTPVAASARSAAASSSVR